MKRVLVTGLTNSLAGTEAVIANIVTAIGNRIAFDFLVFEEPSNYGRLFEGDNRYILVPNKRVNLLQYYRSINSHFAQHAHEYDAVWSNLNILNNVDSLRLGAKHGIPRRILHAHNSRKDGKPHQRLLCAMHKGSVDAYVTDRWACSSAAAKFFFGDKDYVFVPNAVSMSNYAFDVQERARVRNQFQLGDSFVIGTVGRLTAQKGQDLLIAMMPFVLDAQPNAKLVIIGSGELEGVLKEQAALLGISGSVVFAGSRRDIPACLSSFDVFVLPSLFEGLPVSLIEAQANGLPCAISDGVSREAIFTDSVTRINRDSPQQWASSVLNMTREGVGMLAGKQRQFDLSAQADILTGLF